MTEVVVGRHPGCVGRGELGDSGIEGAVHPGSMKGTTEVGTAKSAGSDAELGSLAHAEWSGGDGWW
ncbi:MAG: hypothetical protein V4531_05325 [Actinomycetota bacterium]